MSIFYHRFGRNGFAAGILFVLMGCVGSVSAETIVEIGTVHGRLKYDVEAFTVKPGKEVILRFGNTDEMQHNLLICSPGDEVAMTVAQAAWALGAEAVAKQFIPDVPAVLHATPVVDPGESAEIQFTAPDAEGDYPYVCTLPGHAFTMRGVMRVSSSENAVPAEPTLTDLVYLYHEGEWENLPDFGSMKPLRVKPVPSNVIEVGVVDTIFNFGLVFYGELSVPRSGEYTFHLNSNDGSRLLIDGEMVVEFDGTHGATGFVKGVVTLEAGAHQLELQYFQNAGGKDIMLALTGSGIERTLFTKSDMAEDQPTHLHAMNEALVVRAFVDGGPARSISVALPGGMNYLFNAEKCFVEFGWTGAFLDNTPNIGRNINDRGGGWDKVLGEKFEVGTGRFPLIVGRGKQDVQFRGYRRTGTPQFFYTVDGIEVKQTISAAPSGVGLKYDFEIDAKGERMIFQLNPDGLSMVSDVGKFRNGVLQVPPSANGKFSVTITRK